MVVEVAVIASLIARSIWRQIVACMTVTAARQSAGIGAGVGIALVTVVTVLNASLYQSIAASRSETVICAGVGVETVAIIAGFLTLADTVTAAS